MSTTIGSRLPRGVTLEGAIRGQGDLRVAGEVLGPIEIDGHLVIEDGGVVRGEIRARTITISGILEGNATALELVRLEPGARMTGDARAERVSAAQGALLKGRVRTSQERAQLERMRRTTGGTLLAPFSSSGSILAPPSDRSASGDVVAPIDREAVVARVTREAVIDARDPATLRDSVRITDPTTLAAIAADNAIVAKPTQPLPERARPASKPAPEPERRAEMDRPPAPVMPAIGRRRAQRRAAESAS